MPDELLQRLRALTEVVMKEIVALDQFQGAKGAWRYMFGGSSITGECVHLPEWAALSELPVIDAILTEFWGSAEYTCHGGGGDFILPGSEYQPLHSVRPLPHPRTPPTPPATPTPPSLVPTGVCKQVELVGGVPGHGRRVQDGVGRQHRPSAPDRPHGPRRPGTPRPPLHPQRGIL